MQLKTILNRVEPLKSFVYAADRIIEGPNGPVIEIEIQPRQNSRPACSGCGRKCPGYDHLEQRRFEFVPLWGIAVTFLYVMRRVKCPRCDVKVELLPWAEGKEHLTRTYQWFLARWAKRLSWSDVAVAFSVSWEHVYHSVRMAVGWGLAQRSLDGIEAIGIDEVAWHKGHIYLTLVYQIDKGVRRLLYVGADRTKDSLRGFFTVLGVRRSALLKFICSDMWKPYLAVIAEQARQATHVLDRYHIMALMHKAIDAVRAEEVKRLKQEGYEPVLKHSRWCLLKRAFNLTARQVVRLSELLKYNLATVRAYLLKEDFHRFWNYKSPFWATQFLKQWCTRTMRSRIGPMKDVARTLRTHEGLILNWFHAKGTISAGIVEGLNVNVKLTMRKAYGFRTFEAVETALYHSLGELPEPPHTHRFC